MAESLLHILINLLSSLRRQVIRRWIILEVELGPNNEMNNLLIDTIWPIIVQDLDVV